MTGETVNITHWPNPHGSRHEDVTVDVTGEVVDENEHHITVLVYDEPHTYLKGRNTIVRRQGDVRTGISTYGNRKSQDSETER